MKRGREEPRAQVLVVEEWSGGGSFLGKMLAHSEAAAGFEFHFAPGRAEALAWLRQGGLADVLLLDLGGGRHGSLDGFAELFAAAPGAAWVVVGNGRGGTLAAEAARTGVEDFLRVEEINPALLSHTLRHGLERMRSRMALKRASGEIEARVLERTAQLAGENARLQRALEERQRAEVSTLENNRQLAAALSHLRPGTDLGVPAGRVEALEGLAAEVLADFNQAFAPVLECCERLSSAGKEAGDAASLDVAIQEIRRAAEETVKVVNRLQDAVPTPVSGPGVTGAGGGPLKILVVEDEPRVREILRMFLEEDRHETVMAGNGREGIERFREGRFDLVLTDRVMPEMDGQELARAVRELNPSQPVIMLTGYGDVASGGLAAEGVDLVVGKPFSLKVLRQAIADVLGTHAASQKAAAVH